MTLRLVHNEMAAIGSIAERPVTGASARVYLQDFEYACSVPPAPTIATPAEIYYSMQDTCQSPEITDIIDSFSQSDWPAARIVAALMTKRWLIELYNPTDWPCIARPFKDLLQDDNERVLLSACEARRAFIGAATCEWNVQQRRRIMQKLLQSSAYYLPPNDAA